MRLWVLLLAASILAGCQSNHEYLLSQGYPPAFADGFDAGCSSGRNAAGAISDGFQKDVPRYLKDKTYAKGWDDGFRQCQAKADREERRAYFEHVGQKRADRDRAWEREKNRALSRSLRGR
ncbi:hypothetical protein [Pseudomonas sp. LRF_L74]|uniref:hypothetical protein n=1 Tax=Pseudomonas sp. LRF_L74 TaxID=3369422 RepID=UPI003F646489